MSQDRERSRSRSPNRNPNPPPMPSNGDAESSGPVKLYIGNIDYGTDGERLRETFEKYGNVTDAFVPMERGTQRPRGFGFVTFATREEAMGAMGKLDGSELDGRTIRISESRPRERSSGPFNASNAAEVKLFVGNLSFDTETEKIRRLFETIGEVKDAYMPSDRGNNKHRGFAFVTMAAQDAEEAMKKLTGEELDGRQIRIEEAGGKSNRPRDDYRGGSGGGYGGDRGYGGGYGDRGNDRGYGDRGNDRGYGGGRDSYRSRDERYGDRRGRDYDRDFDRDRRHDDKRGSDYGRSKDDRYGDRRRDYDRDDYDRDRDSRSHHRDERGRDDRY